MSNYGKNITSEWTPCEEYIEPNYNRMDRFHPILQSELVENIHKEESTRAISRFKVTKLPRGGEKDYLDFTPEIGYVPDGQKKKKQGEKEISKEDIQLEFLTKEEESLKQRF